MTYRAYPRSAFVSRSSGVSTAVMDGDGDGDGEEDDGDSDGDGDDEDDGDEDDRSAGDIGRGCGGGGCRSPDVSVADDVNGGGGPRIMYHRPNFQNNCGVEAQLPFQRSFKR